VLPHRLLALPRLPARAAALAHTPAAPAPAHTHPPQVQAAWLVLEFLLALEQGISAAAEGALQRRDPPRAALAFFAANRRVCEEWFGRCRDLLLQVAAGAGCHHAAVHHGLQRLAALRAQAKALGAAAELQRQREREEVHASGGGAQGGEEAARRGGRPPAGTAAKKGRQGFEEGAQQEQQPAQQQPEPKLILRKEPEADPAAAAAAAGAAAAGPAAAAAGADTSAAAQQADAAAALLRVLRQLGASLAQLGGAEAIGGLYAWCRPRFAGVLQGAGGAAPAFGSDALDQQMEALGAGSSHDALSWLQALQLQAAGSHAAAAGAYSSWLAWSREARPFAAALRARPPAAGGSGSGGLQPGPAEVELLELFLLERLAECRAALCDWRGLQELSQRLGSGPAGEGASEASRQWWGAAQAQMREFFACAPPGAAEGLPGAPGSQEGAVPAAVQAALQALSSQGVHKPRPVAQQQQAAALQSLQAAWAELQAAARSAAQLHLPHHSRLLSDMAAVQWLHHQVAGPPRAAGQAPELQQLLQGLRSAQQDAAQLLATSAPAAADWLAHGSCSLLQAPPGSGQAAQLHGTSLRWDLRMEPGAAPYSQHLGKLLSIATTADPAAQQSATAALCLHAAKGAHAAGDTQLALELLQRLAPQQPGQPASAQHALLQGAALHLQLQAGERVLAPAQAAQQLRSALQPHIGRVLAGSAEAADTSSASCLAEAFLALAHLQQQAAQQQEQQQQPAQAADWAALHSASLAACLAAAPAPSLERAASLLAPEVLAPAACYQLALASMPGYGRAWQQLGDLLFRHTQVRAARAALSLPRMQRLPARLGAGAAPPHQHAAANPLPHPLTPSRPLQDQRARSKAAAPEAAMELLQGYAAAVEAYCHQLQATGQGAMPEANTRVLLHVLQVGACCCATSLGLSSSQPLHFTPTLPAQYCDAAAHSPPCPLADLRQARRSSAAAAAGGAAAGAALRLAAHRAAAAGPALQRLPRLLPRAGDRAAHGAGAGSPLGCAVPGAC
jgi:hypothetical protein